MLYIYKKISAGIKIDILLFSKRNWLMRSMHFLRKFRSFLKSRKIEVSDWSISFQKFRKFYTYPCLVSSYISTLFFAKKIYIAINEKIYCYQTKRKATESILIYPKTIYCLNEMPWNIFTLLLFIITLFYYYYSNGYHTEIFLNVIDTLYPSNRKYRNTFCSRKNR